MATLFHKPGPPGSVFLATPAYAGVEPNYAFALFQTATELAKAGIAAEIAIQAGDCHVDDARNRLVKTFLATECTDLVFLDADLRWQPRDLIKLLSYDRDVVGGAYPLKQDPAEFAVEWLEDTPNIVADGDGLIEVKGLPTGFLRIRRAVLERLAFHAPKFAAKGDDKPTTPLIFERSLSDGRRVGGDITFCHKARAAGFKVHLMPEPGFEHAGTKLWRGSLGFQLRSLAKGPIRTAIDEIATGTASSDTYDRLHEAWGNPYAASGDLLCAASLLLKGRQSPMVVEYGSGLSTLVMAASGAKVIAMENDPEWIAKIRSMAADLGLSDRITIYETPVVDGWYDADAGGVPLPIWCSLAFIDGPSRRLGGRQKAHVVPAEKYLFDDIHDPGVQSAVARIAADGGLDVHRFNVGHARAFALLYRQTEKTEAA